MISPITLEMILDLLDLLCLSTFLPINNCFLPGTTTKSSLFSMCFIDKIVVLMPDPFDRSTYNSKESKEIS